jgi:exodeoxyribonuclease V beta subunit
MVEERLPRRALATLDGERTLTDIRHVGRLLHVAAADGQLGVASLAGWLSEQIAEAPDEAEAEERTRRLEGDDDAVQVLTVHRAKGLEFPVVYCPFLFVPGYVPRKGEADPRFHAPPDDVRTLDVGGRTGEDYDAHYAAHLAEERGEDLRLAYVALTRARHRVVTWWAPYRDVGDSPLARLLLGRDPSSGEVAVSVEAPGLPRVRERLEELAGAAPDCIAIEESGWHDVGPGDARAGPAATLRAATLERALDARWQRTSYSRITERAHEAPAVASEPERTDGVAPDEPDVEPAEEAAAAQAVPDVPLPLAGLAGGTDLGHLVHRVLERTDFSAPELEAGLRARIVAESARGGPADLDAAVLAAGLRAAVETPLGPLVGDMRLRDIAPGDRIDELGFELPLAGGESPHGEVTVAALAGLLRDHLPEHDPVRPYADRLGDPMLGARLRGYMVGSIDLVWRLSDGGRPRFVVVDHKTNRLAPREQRPTAAHFRPAALDRAMREADYPLQALVYQVALHRYLRWRVPGYDPGRDLAGVLYLFTRGLVGADVPRVAGAPIGVWAWHPPAVLVEAVSDLFDRGAPS